MFRLLRKRLFKTNKTKGFTLTELIVVVAVVALLMTCVVAFAAPVRTAVKGATSKADCLTINQLVSSYIQHKLAYANKIEVFVGRDYNDAGLIREAYLGKDGDSSNNGFAGLTKISDEENHPGMMVLHYCTDKNDPTKHTFKLYDFAIEKTGSHDWVSSMPTKEQLFNDDPTDAKKCVESNLVYLDEFYGGYEFFMAFDGPAGAPDNDVDTASLANVQTRRAYLNMHIDSYNITGEWGHNSFSRNDIIDYYLKYTSDGNFSSKMDDYRNERVATEKISFTLENIKMKVETKLVDTDGDGTEDTKKTFPKLDGLKIHRGNGAGGYDTDVVIFYNVRIYDITTDHIG